jgi:hypothetical protein
VEEIIEEKQKQERDELLHCIVSSMTTSSNSFTPLQLLVPESLCPPYTSHTFSRTRCSSSPTPALRAHLGGEDNCPMESGPTSVSPPVPIRQMDLVGYIGASVERAGRDEGGGGATLNGPSPISGFSWRC